MVSRGPRPSQTQALRRLGRRIASLREARGWSQKDFANRLGRGVNSISRWENGTHQIGVLDALAAARAFGVSLSSLVGEPDQISTGALPPPDVLAEGLDLLERARKLLNPRGLDLLVEAHELLRRLPDQGNP